MLRLRRMLLHRRWTGMIAAVMCLVALGVASCAPAYERPLRGAQPGTLAPTPPGLPPTLEPSEALRFRALPSPSPGVAANPSPVASPAAVASPSAVAPPIVRTIVPS